MAVILVLLIALVGLGAPIWAAQYAAPLGRMKFRWGAWLAIQTALVSGGMIATAFLVAGSRGGVGMGSLALMTIGALGFAAAMTLQRRRQVGVVLALLSEIGFLMLAYVAPSTIVAVTVATPVLLLIVINVVYFKKRWKVMIDPEVAAKNAPRRKVIRGQLSLDHVKRPQRVEHEKPGENAGHFLIR